MKPDEAVRVLRGTRLSTHTEWKDALSYARYAIVELEKAKQGLSVEEMVKIMKIDSFSSVDKFVLPPKEVLIQIAQAIHNAQEKR